MQDFQQRVVDEKAELDARRERLTAFKATDQFAALSPAPQALLDAQAIAMTRYSDILRERIALFATEA